MKKKKGKILLSDKLLLCLYAFCVIFSMTPSINVISLYVFVPIMGCVILVNAPKFFYDNKYLYLYLILVLWMSFTAFTAENPDVAWRHMIRVLAAYVFSVISFYLSSKLEIISLLYLIVVARFLAIFYRASSGGDLVVAENVMDRNQFEGVNANMLAYFLFYASFAVYMLQRLCIRQRTYVIFFISVLLIIFSFYISLITASRQVLLIQLPLIISLLMVMYFKFTVKNIFILAAFAILLIFIGLPIAEEYFSNSLLAERSMESVTDDSRFNLIKKAIEEGTNYPLLGMGPNNFVLRYNVFTHNTYLELLVSSGFPAMLIYICMLIRFIYLQFRRYRRTGDRTFLMFFIYACTFFVDNIFYVFIGNMWLMGLFFIVVGHSEQYYKSYIYETKEC